MKMGCKNMTTIEVHYAVASAISASPGPPLSSGQETFKSR
jgi:hypothetical protein